MGNPREDAIRRSHTPAPSIGPPGSGPGSQGNVNTNPANDWIGSPQDTSVYYGNLPQSQGNTNVNVSNPAGGNYQGPVVNTGGGGSGLPGGGTDTGSGSSGGRGSKGPAGMTLDELRLFNQITGSNIDILDTRGGIGNMRTKSIDGLTITDKQQDKDLEYIDVIPEYNENYKVNTDMFRPEITNDVYTGDDEEIIEGPVEDPYSFGDPNKGPNWSADKGNQFNYNFTPNTKLMIEPNLGKKSLYFGLHGTYGNAQGGPVGLMSLPQGYANGGEVIEGTDTMEELRPFGGTRENVWDQVEAFDNAPQHIEEPMIGMWGEKVPLGIARRVQGYMEGLDPVKRNLIQEMMQMFHMKKMMEKHQDQEQSGQYFGPQPNEYAI